MPSPVIRNHLIVLGIIILNLNLSHFTLNGESQQEFKYFALATLNDAVHSFVTD